MCKISEPAAKRRYHEFIEWKSHKDAIDEYDKKIFNYYYKFIYKRECKNCDASLIQRYGKYCPVCGKKNTLQWGGENSMIYSSYETDDNGRLKKCAICNNEQLFGRYCHICSADVINYCSDAINHYYDDYEHCTNTSPLPSNARYCPICGGESTFYQKTILKPWNYNKSESSDGFMNIPDGIDEELPFN